MYQTRIEGQGLLLAQSQGYGEPISLFGKTDQGETPMSLVTIALASCVTMCIQSYFNRHLGQPDLAISLDARQDQDWFDLVVQLDQPLSETREQELRTFVDQHCKVKKLLREDLTIRISFVSEEKS